ncbi:MAG: septum formation protein [Oleiphilaceae bacterium]|jgi:septum formation protein
MTELLLASASSRRKELLDQIGVRYQSVSMDIDEAVYENEAPSEYVLRLASEKAQAGIQVKPDMLVLAADTTVVVSGKILGKPDNEEAARDMLRQLSGRVHQVLTGIAVARWIQGKVSLESQAVVTDVYFGIITDQQIEEYIKTGEPMGKAGAYGIQGKAALFVERIEGSYSNVVGLPLAETGKLLERYHVHVWK